MIAVFDIDGTLRRAPDPWLGLHRHLGTDDRGEEFYRKFRAGELTYSEMAALDVSTWRGLSLQRMLTWLDENPIREGADRLVKWFADRCIPCIGISTGLSIFNDITMTVLGLNEVISNVAVFSEGVCTGSLVVNVEEHGKADVLHHVCQRYAVGSDEVVAFGDSRADIPMFEMASVSVAVFPRSEDVAHSADFVVDKEPIDSVCNKLDSIVVARRGHNHGIRPTSLTRRG